MPLASARRASFMAVLFGLPAVVAALPLELVIRDSIGKSWRDEPITWQVELPAGAWNGKGNGLVTRDGKPIPGQASVVERHGDGSARQVEVRFIIDQLAQDGRTEIAWDPARTGPPGTNLAIEKADGMLVLGNAHAAVKLVNRNLDKADAGPFSPILGVRTRSGKWTAPSSYDTQTARPVGTKTELLEEGPVRLAARVTTKFDNARTHQVLVSLWAGSRAIDVEESFDLGPDEKYQFKKYETDRDELSWEWWSWYGDVAGDQETHPNYWVVPLASDAFQPSLVRYRGESSTDKDKGETSGRGESQYTLSFAKPRRLEKYLAGHGQWPTRRGDLVRRQPRASRQRRRVGRLHPFGPQLAQSERLPAQPDDHAADRGQRHADPVRVGRPPAVGGLPDRAGAAHLGHPRLDRRGELRRSRRLAVGAVGRGRAAQSGPRRHAAVDHRLGYDVGLPTALHQARRARSVLRTA
jgi:hypothetical protein